MFRRFFEIWKRMYRGGRRAPIVKRPKYRSLAFDVLENRLVPAGQWASAVVDFSTEYSVTSWAAVQAVSEPDTMTYGDIATAWAPLPINSGGEFDAAEHVTLRFANPVNATGVLIRETFGNGFVYQVDFLSIDETGTQTVYTWTGTDPSQPGSPVDFTISIPQTVVPVNAVKIYVNIDHDLSAWEEIDAVRLLDGANTAPTFIGSDQTVNEDAPAQSITGWASFNPGSGSWEATQKVSNYTVSNISNASLFSSSPSVDANGTLTYALVANANGVANFDVFVKDDGGTSNGGVDTSAAQTFTITVNAVNDAPSFTVGADVTVNEDSGAYSAAWASNVSTGPANEGQSAAFTVSNDNASLFSVAPGIAADGTLTFTSAANAFGSATVTVSLSDGMDTSTPVTFMVTITAVNFAPVIGNVVFDNTEPKTNDLLTAQVIDPVDPDDDTITYNYVWTVNGQTVKTTTTSATTDTLDLSQAGNGNKGDSILVSVTPSDGIEAGSSKSASTVVVNSAPTAASQSFSTSHNQVIYDIDLVFGAFDADGDPVQASIYGPPSNGALVLNGNGKYDYYPSGSWTGTETFNVVVSDGIANAEAVTLTIAVDIIDLPEVSISSVPDDLATEGEEDNAGFVVTRTGDAGNSLTVNLAFSGTATMEGTSLTESGDYGLLVGGVYLSSSVTFEPGQSSVTVTFAGYDDDQVEESEEALLSIAGSGGGTYQIAANNYATISIADTTAWDDGAKKLKHVPILLQRLTINVKDNDFDHKVNATVTLTAGRQYNFAAYGTAKIGLGANDDVDPDWASWNPPADGGPFKYMALDATPTNDPIDLNIGLKAVGLWSATDPGPFWGDYNVKHEYSATLTPGTDRIPAFYFQDIPEGYAGNSGTLTVEIGQRAPFGTMPPPRDDNPNPPAATATNLTVAIVTGAPAERTSWSDSARTYQLIGPNAYIYNTITNLQGLANALSIFPNGSIGTLVFGGHGAGGDIGVQIANGSTFAPDGTSGQYLSYTNLQNLADNNAAQFHAIADKIKFSGTVRFEACGTYSEGRTANALALASLLNAVVEYSDGLAYGWGQGTWVTADPT